MKNLYFRINVILDYIVLFIAIIALSMILLNKFDYPYDLLNLLIASSAFFAIHFIYIFLHLIYFCIRFFFRSGHSMISHYIVYAPILFCICLLLSFVTYALPLWGQWIENVYKNL